MTPLLVIVAAVIAGALPGPRWLAWLIPVIVGVVLARWLLIEAGLVEGDRSNPPETGVAAVVLVVSVTITGVAVLVGRRLGRLVGLR